MRRTRARLLAVVVVVGSMVGSALALEIWPNAQPPQSNPAVLASMNGRVVFSIRNTDASSLAINGFSAVTGADPQCATLNAPVPLGGGGFPVTIAAGAQAQFVVDLISPYFSAPGDRTCSYQINATPAPSSGPTSVTIVFHVNTTSTFDTQPTVMDFGSQTVGNFETQALVVTGYGGAQSVTVNIENDPGHNFELVGCGTTTSCAISSPGGGAFNSVNIRCTGSNAGPVTALATVHAVMAITPLNMPQTGSTGTDVTVTTTALSCTGVSTGGTVSLTPDPLNIVAAQGQLGTMTIDANGSGSASGASITGYPQFAISGCGQSCGGFALPTTLQIECTPTSSQTQATLTVDHALGGSATATIFCTPSSTPLLFVSPSSLSFGSIDVGSMGSQSLHIENQGGGTLTGVAISFPGANGGNYYADACTTSSPCTIGNGSGSAVDVPIWFAPQIHGPLLSSLEVTANEAASPETVGLSGTGLGGVMVVTAPSSSTNPPFHLDFGTIPKGQNANALVTLRNDGNKLFTAMLDGVAPPYSVTSSMLPVAESTSDSFHVSCGSSTPAPATLQIWTVSSDAYTGSPQSVSASCAIADTAVNVNPLMFDFGEVRVGTPAQEMTVTVSNPSSNAGAAQIKRMELHEARAGLSLIPPTTMQSLGLGEQVTATLHLDTAADTDLTGEQLDIDVDNANLALPVRGKVVTPHSRVVPDKLDLGTACMGTQVSGSVKLINDGTATLQVMRPEMSESFVAATPGSLYPVALPATMSVQADVSPAVSAAGTLEGLLTWSDDVPSTHEVPVVLEYIDSGTALSPRALDYGVVEVGAPSSTQRLLLENCDAEPAKITVKSVRGTKGPIGAWEISPRVGYDKTLGAHDKQAVDVTFKPPARGTYEAQLVVSTSSGAQTVLLVGEATGRDFDHTSFYTCSCGAPGAPWGGWPLPAAIFIVIVRRRRGSSSPR